MAEKKQRRLKNFILSHDAQLRIIIPNLYWMLLIVVATLGVVLSPLMIDMILADDIEIQYRAAITFLALIKRLVPTIIAMFVLIFLHQIIITHRICGPMINFRLAFKKISEGDFLSKVGIRREDYMKSECESINEMIDGLNYLVKRVKVSNEKQIESIEKIMNRVDDIKTKDQVQEALELLKREANNVKKNLSDFKLEN
jgi:methyl-accepting chemotaxis protein